MADQSASAPLPFPAAGDAAPGLEAAGTTGPFSPAGLRGQWWVLFFYPRDNTPGCTTETADFTRLHGAFGAAGCAVVGASRDSLASHQKFAQKLGVPFNLVSDPDEQLCQAWDVIRDKSMYGKTVRGIERSTFLVDPSGAVHQVWRKVRVPGHAEAVLKALLAAT